MSELLFTTPPCGAPLPADVCECEGCGVLGKDFDEMFSSRPDKRRYLCSECYDDYIYEMSYDAE